MIKPVLRLRQTFSSMLDQAHRIDLLQCAVEAMAQQMTQLQAEIATLRAEAEASSQCQQHLMARADQIDAMNASLSALEERLLLNRRSIQVPQPSKRPNHRQVKLESRRIGRRHQRLTIILLSAVSLFGGMALALRSMLFHKQVLPFSKESVTRQEEAGTPQLTLTAQGKTWLEVQGLDGKILHYGIANPGIYRFPVTRAVRIRAGRPDLVSVSFLGSNAALGTIEATGWHVYKTSSAVRDN